MSSKHRIYVAGDVVACPLEEFELSTLGALHELLVSWQLLLFLLLFLYPIWLLRLRLVGCLLGHLLCCLHGPVLRLKFHRGLRL